MNGRLRVLVTVPLNPYSGYGNDGIGIVRALNNMGADVYIDPTVATPPLPQDIANLFTKKLEAPFDLNIHHVDPGHLELTPEKKRAADVTVAWSMWEYSSMANLKEKRTLRKRLKSYDAILGYDQVTTEAFRPYLQKATRNTTPQALGVLQGGYQPGRWPTSERDWFSNHFGFIMVGDCGERKDPFVAIQAFEELKEEFPEEMAPVTLSIKSSRAILPPAMEEWLPGLKIYNSIWSEETMLEFYGSNHVLLAPSRGEGKNMPALEFQSTGGAVIATNWGGHQQWLNPEYSYPLDYTLAPVEPRYGDSCMNARASKDHLKQLMLYTLRNRGEVKRKAEIASQVIPAQCSWDTVIHRLFQTLKTILPEKGERLYNKALMTANVAHGAGIDE